MIWLLACHTPEAPVPAPLATQASDADLVALPAPRLLRRMSLDLRGILPSTEELDAVEADPSQLKVLRDAYLEDSHFEPRMVAMLAETWHTRVDTYLISFWEYPQLQPDPFNEFPFEQSIGEEPLRLMAHIAAEDDPWTGIVTADYTMANEMLANIWPMTREAGEGWQPSHYTDGRPAAGVLSTDGLWWRYYSSFSNLNRSRVALIARMLLCEDFLSRPVSLSSSLITLTEESTEPVDTGKMSSGGGGIEDEIRSNPACLSCHAAVDPMAASLFGFWSMVEYNIDEVDYYHPERERLGPLFLDTEPAYYGVPISGLAELGQRISQDPRFERCAAKSMAEMYWHRPSNTEDFDRIEGLKNTLITAEMRPKALIRAITDTAVYQAGGLSAQASETVVEQENTHRMFTTPLLESVLSDLTNLSWVYQGFDQFQNDTFGFRILGGGVDGAYVLRPQTVPGLTWALVVQRVAEGAADRAVAQQLQGEGERRLFGEGFSATTASTDAAFGAELDRLYWRLYGERPESDWHSQIIALYDAVESSEGGAEAWKSVLTAMFRDPLFTWY